MLFHVRSPEARGFAPKPNKTEGRDREPPWELSLWRILGGLALLALPLVGAFVAKSLYWDEGATTMLHLTEVAFGGLVGSIFGEKIAISDAERS
jgi:hypothetical protein